MTRRFPAPWRIRETPGGYAVESLPPGEDPGDATGFIVAYVYGDDRPKGAGDRSMSKDEARRIAAGIARLPELIGRG